jgi:Predicted O-methyltransferase
LDIEINPNERIDDLQIKGLKLIQNTEGFCFGVDAVLLSDFADVKDGARVADLGTGTGIIPLLLAGKTKAREITGIEIQKDIAQMAKRSVTLNSLNDRVSIVEGDIKSAVAMLGKSTFDVVVSNPPYMNSGGGLINPKDTKAISRHEILCTLEDVVSAAAGLLKPAGQFAMVHRPERIVDILCLMRKYKLEPKYLRFVHPSPDKKANLILVKGTSGGRPQLKMLPPLYVFERDGKYSKEIDDIYGRDSK